MGTGEHVKRAGKLLVLTLLVFWMDGAAAEPGIWTGYVTDTHCGTNCQRTSDMKPDRQCIETCIKKGSKYGLWSGKQVYVLEPQAKAAKFAAENVEVKGTIVENTIHITSIRPLP
jgi:hypothetical protein